MTQKTITSNWLTYLSFGFTFFVRIAIIALVCILALVVYRGLHQDGYRVRSFQMPKHLQDAGYTGSVAAITMQGKVSELKKIASSLKTDSTSFNVESGPDLSLDLMGVGLSTGSIIFHMRELLGRKNNLIDGSITYLDDVVSLHLWMTGYNEFVHEVDVKDSEVRQAIEQVITEGAKYVIGNTDPYRLAILHYRNDDLAKAEEVIRHVIANVPQDRKWAYNLWGNLKANNNQEDLAIKYYRRAIDIDPSFELPRRLLGWQLVAKKEYEEALVHFEEAISLGSQYLPAYNGAALCHRTLGNYDMAEEYYKTAANKFPDNIWTYGNLSDFLIRYRRDTIEAANVWKKAGNHLDESADYYISTSAFNLMTGDTITALENAKSALELDPDNPSTLRAFASFLEENGDFGRAEEYRKRLVYVYNIGIYDEAMRSSAYNTLSINEYTQGKLDSAYVHVMSAIKLDPENPYPWTTLAEIRILEKDRQGFYSAIDKAVELGMSYQDWMLEWPYSLMIDDPKYATLVKKLKNDAALKG